MSKLRGPISRKLTLRHSDGRVGEIPFSVVAVGIAVLLLVGLGIGSLLTQTALRVPLCYEDEVILSDGRCHPADDSTYERRLGWVPKFGTTPAW